MTDATPRPWVFNGFDMGIYSPDGESVTVIAMGKKRSDGDLIVRAVNNHDALVEALEGARCFIDEWDFDRNGSEVLEQVVAALAAVREPAP